MLKGQIIQTLSPLITAIFFLTGNVAKAASEAEEGIFKKFSPAVVMIETDNSLSKSEPCHTAGTGFFVSPDGDLVTNRHVMQCAIKNGGKGISFILGTKGHPSIRSYQIGSCGSNAIQDFCILKLPLYPEISFSVGRLEAPLAGALVYTIGNPLGKNFQISSGEFRRTMNHDGLSEILTTVPIKPGNSGGPMFREDGRLLGIATMIRGVYSPYTSKVRNTATEEPYGLSVSELNRFIERFYQKGGHFVSPETFVLSSP